MKEEQQSTLFTPEISKERNDKNMELAYKGYSIKAILMKEE